MPNPANTVSALPPILQFSTVSQFEKIWSSRGSGAMEGRFFRPLPPAGWFLLGDYAQGNFLAPTGTVFAIRVEADDEDFPALKAPQKWVRVWSSKGSKADSRGSFWVPIPHFGYVTCGHAVAADLNTPPEIPNFRCLRYDLAKSTELGKLIWNDRHSHADTDVSVYRVPVLNVFWAIPNYNTPTETANIPASLANS